MGCILFVGLGILMILLPETFESRRYGNPKEILFIVGCISIIFFTPFLFSILIKLLDNKPGLIISKEGIYENSGGAPTGLIEWNDIKKITSMGDIKNMIILIHVQNPNKYIDREPNFFKRWIMRNNYKYYYTPVQITCNTLQCSGTVLLTNIKNKFNHIEQEKAR